MFGPDNSSGEHDLDTSEGTHEAMKAALVTGGGRRIGAAIARDLAEHGWAVALHFNRSADDAATVASQIQAAGGQAVTIGADLGRPEAAGKLIEQAFDLLPRLELVINNASAFAYDDAATCTPAALTENFAVNAIAPISIAQRFAALLPQGRPGCVVNILDNRVFAPNPDYFSYGISKFAALGATRMLALALAPRIRVNGIAPGITLPSGAQTPEQYEVASRLNPLQRACSPEEIAAAVRLIAGSPAMTGAVITIDGGLALANPGRDVAFIEPGTT